MDTNIYNTRNINQTSSEVMKGNKRMFKEVKIYVGEPWDMGIVDAYITEEKEGMLMFYSEKTLDSHGICFNKFYGKKRHIENTSHYNFLCILGDEDYSLDNIAEYEKNKESHFVMIGSVHELPNK